MSDHFTLTVNGHVHEIDAAGTTPLLDVLRNHLGLKGSRFGCGLEQCGACMVLVDGETYLMTLGRYVVRNPVRAKGMVTHPGEWPWSSYRAKAGLADPPPWLTVTNTLVAFHPTDLQIARKNYREYANAPDADDPANNPWKQLRSRMHQSTTGRLKESSNAL